MSTKRSRDLQEFVDWAGTYLKGDEKGEAQVFLDHLFRAFGHGGVQEAGATLEQRIAPKEGKKAPSFADLVWKPRVLIEMKRRGEDLTKHFRQAFEYWVQLVPDRPRYVILCNFDEFWIYDFDRQLHAPLDKVPLEKLPNRWGALAFLFPKDEKPLFRNDLEAVTRKAADHLAGCFNKLVDPNRPGGPIDRTLAQRFILQALVALFAEDIDLLERYTVARLLDEQTTADVIGYDLLGGLFEEMNRPGRTPAGRFQGVEYFNGGLFAEPARVPLRQDEWNHLREAARDDWSKVNPEIFGALFEESMEAEERHAFGAHFTSPTDIMKIVGPTVVQPWRDRIEAADTPEALMTLHQRMLGYRVLDPACGSGNFLYLAYRLGSCVFTQLTIETCTLASPDHA